MELKEQLIKKLQNNDLTNEQVKEIKEILDGTLTEKILITKAEAIITRIIKTLEPHWSVLLYRFLILATFSGLICFLAVKTTNKTTGEISPQVWTIVGAFVGFVFGQKSSILRF